MEDNSKIASNALFMVSIIISIVVNIATSILPESMTPYLWLSWPLLFLLIIAALILMNSQKAKYEETSNFNKDEAIFDKLPKATKLEREHPASNSINSNLPEIENFRRLMGAYSNTLPKKNKAAIRNNKIQAQYPNRILLGIGLTIIVLDFIYFLNSQTLLDEELRFLISQDIPLVLLVLGVVITYFGLVFGITVFRWVIFLTGMYFILHFQISAYDFHSWWYAWTLFPAFWGLGHFIDKFLIDLCWVVDYSDIKASYETGNKLIVSSAILFSIVAILFYGLFGFWGRVMVILFIGMFFIYRAFLPQEEKKVEIDSWE